MLNWIKRKLKKQPKKDADVHFSVLADKRMSWKGLLDQLKALNIEILQEDKRTSDYIKCKTTKENFCSIFNTTLQWQTLEVGSWEIKGKSEMPGDLFAKEILLHRDLLFPYGFIKNKTISKNP